jgi:uridine kinase
MLKRNKNQINSLVSQITKYFKSMNSNRMIVGVSGAAGSGKSTFIKQIADDYVSMDDFYYSKKDQLQRNIPSRLDLRSCDVPTLLKLLKDFKSEKLESCHIPYYSKGLDDRLIGKEKFISLNRPILYIEGWRIGIDYSDYHTINHEIDYLIYIDADETFLKASKFQSAKQDALEHNLAFHEEDFALVYEKYHETFLKNYSIPVKYKADAVVIKKTSHAIEKIKFKKEL